MIAPARRVAYDVVLRVFEEDAYADRAFASAAAAVPDAAEPRTAGASR